MPQAHVLRDDGLSALVVGDLRTIARGFTFTEGPLGLPGGGLIFQDMKASRTHRVSEAGALTTLREDTRGANGQTFLPGGRVIFCEQDGRRVSAMGLDGRDVAAVAERWEGRRLNSPNDIVCRSDGLVFFSDPPYGVTPEARELPFQAVFALDPARGDAGLRPLAEDFEKPNGLAFAPDERTLYVCDTARYHVRAFQVAEDGSLSGGRVFAEQDPGEPGGPDGLKVDREGRVYVAVALGVWVYGPEGRLLGILATPKRPSNLAWGGPDGDLLSITAADAVHRVRLQTRGVTPPFEPPAPASRPGP